MVQQIIKSFCDLIYKAWTDQGNENATQIGPAILFTFNYLKKKCLENEANRQIAGYSYCNKIYMLLVYRETKQRKD